MIHVLLTRTPLYSGLLHFLVRLACVKRAASVDSEPGSNSRLNLLISIDLAAHLAGDRSKTRPADLFDRFSFELKLLTNYCLLRSASHPCGRRLNAVAYFYFASNQIVKDLRSGTRDPCRKTNSLPASKAVRTKHLAKRTRMTSSRNYGNLKELLQMEVSKPQQD